MEIEAGPNWDDDLGGSPVYAANDPNLAHVSAAERSALFEVAAARLLLPAPDLQPLPQPDLRGGLPVGRPLQAGRGRDRAAQPGALPRLALLRHRVPVQEGLLQLVARARARSASSATRASRPGRRPACFHSCVGRIRYLGHASSTTPSRSRRRCAADDEGPGRRRSAGMILDPNDPEVIAAAKRERHHRRRDRLGAEVARLQVGDRVGAGAAAPRRAPDAARCCSTSRRSCP